MPSQKKFKEIAAQAGFQLIADQIISPPASGTTASPTANTVNKATTLDQKAKMGTATKSTKSTKSTNSTKKTAAASQSDATHAQGKKRKVTETIQISDDEDDDGVPTKKIKSDPGTRATPDYPDSDFTDEERNVRGQRERSVTLRPKIISEDK